MPHIMPINTSLEQVAEQLSGLAKPVIESGCRLIESLLGEPCKLAGNILADQIQAWQWTNRIRIAHRAKKLLEKDHLAPKFVPPDFLLPVLENAGNVSDPALQELWAQLLASAVADAKNQHPSFIHILRQLSKGEAVLLSLIAAACFRIEETFDYDSHAKGYVKRSVDPERFPLKRLSCDEATMWFYLSHLSLVGVILPSAEEEVILGKVGSRKEKLGKRRHTFVELTDLGRHFLLACCPRKELLCTTVREPWRIVFQARELADDAVRAASNATDAADEAKNVAEEAKDVAEEAKDTAEIANNLIEDAKRKGKPSVRSAKKGPQRHD